FVTPGRDQNMNRFSPSPTLRMLLCATSAFFAGTTFGQTLGEVTGHLSDASGASVPGSAITLTNLATAAVRTAISTDAGDYSFASVPPGLYRVKVEHPGFKAVITSNVEVQVQQTLRLDFAMQVGEVNESVQVQGLADQLQTENATVGTVIENKGIVEL